MNSNETQEAVFIEKKWRPNLRHLMILVTFIFIIYVGFELYSRALEPVNNVPTERAEGVSGPQGMITFNTLQKSQTDTKPNYYSYFYDLSSREPLLLTDKPMSGTKFYSETDSVIVLAPVDQSGATNAIQPHRLNFANQALTLLPNLAGNHTSSLSTYENVSYSYDYAPSPVSQAERAEIKKYETAMHSEGKIHSIKEATNPVFLTSNEVIYLGVDGVYLYTLDTKQISKLIDVSHPTYFDDIAISNDAKYLVYTNINNRAITLYEIGNNNEVVTLTEVVTHTVEDTIYATPTFSPKGDYLSIVSTNVATTSESFLDETIEVRTLPGLVLEETLPLDSTRWGNIYLDSWTEAGV